MIEHSLEIVGFVLLLVGVALANVAVVRMLKTVNQGSRSGREYSPWDVIGRSGAPARRVITTYKQRTGQMSGHWTTLKVAYLLAGTGFALVIGTIFITKILVNR